MFGLILYVGVGFVSVFLKNPLSADFVKCYKKLQSQNKNRSNLAIQAVNVGAAGRIRTADLILTKKPWLLLWRTHSCRERTSNPLCCKGLEVLIVLVRFITYRGTLRGFRVFVGKIVGKMPCVRRKAATQEKSRFECATLATGMSTSPLKWECSFASALSHKQEYLRICSLPFQRCSYQPQP